MIERKLIRTTFLVSAAFMLVIALTFATAVASKGSKPETIHVHGVWDAGIARKDSQEGVCQFPISSRARASRSSGGRPVGLMAAYSANLKGASEIFVVDKIKERLEKAGSIGATPINMGEGEPVDQILRVTGNEGVDRGIDAVGFRGSSSSANTQQGASNTIIN
jgi:hypothetical protein